MPIIRAQVLTASLEDEQNRVRIYAPHVYDPESDLIEVLGKTPLSVGDMVLVDITSVFNPLVIGKCFTSDTVLEGQNLFRIATDDGWTEASVTATKLSIKNNANTEVVIDGNTVTVKAVNVNIQGIEGTNDGKAVVTLNGGGKGQVMNVSDIVTAINNLQTDVANINTAVAAHTHTVATTGSATAQSGTTAVSANYSVAVSSSQIAAANVSDANFKH